VIEIASFDARDKFSRLLDFVQLGEEVVITRRGQPVARLIPSEPLSSRQESGDESKDEHFATSAR
jgi:prevent-host-death family protein